MNKGNLQVVGCLVFSRAKLVAVGAGGLLTFECVLFGGRLGNGGVCDGGNDGILSVGGVVGWYDAV